MDPYAPINGISLERYAELGGALDGIDDPAAQRAKVEQLGVSGADWDAAKAGWTQRMQDPANMGQVATKYMQLYNAALSGSKGNATLSFEDWVYVSAAIQVMGFEAALGQHGLSQGDWTTISADWNTKLSQDPMGLAQRRNALQQQEAQRLQGGGPPRTINVQRTASGQAPAGGAQAYDPMAQMNAQMQAAGANPAAMAQAQAVMAQYGMGGAAAGMPGMGAPAAAPQGGMAPGSQVLVQWSDGNKYPGTVKQSAGGQVEVQFPNGQTVWVQPQFLSPG